MEEVRVTLGVAAVLKVFLEDVSKPRYGYDLMRQTSFASGKLYPILARLEKAGWLIKETENIDPAAEGRPARRMYRLSAEGANAAGRELASVNELVRLPVPRLVGNPEVGLA
ncbi:PadR family transcriptional regulator [Catenulispora rubra]|uniref:PadR family transcriptional regulator n=1 Tax=Catenulispora rubra TaxID=280293 RepID=UPI001892616A|nr:PadR family transcriptional regulator [Catenulispora rubra]